jgi:hypothetical protein
VKPGLLACGGDLAILSLCLVADGDVVARAGTPVYGRVAGSSQAGRIAGRSSLSLTLTEINLGGQTQPIATGERT